MDIDRHLAGSLDSVAMDQSACGARQTDDLADRLQHAGFVVGRHDRHQSRLTGRREHLLEDGQVDHPIAVYRDNFCIRNGPRDAVMLDRRDQHAAAPCTGQRKAVGLRPARRKDDLSRQCSHQARHLTPRCLDEAPRLASGRMNR